MSNEEVTITSRGSRSIYVTIGDKTYIADKPVASGTVIKGERKVLVVVTYWGTRNGFFFGPTRTATGLSKPGVGSIIRDAAIAHFDFDVDAAITAYTNNES